MEYEIIIIGAGPAGYVAAARAGQLGMKTALIEKSHIGGMCLNWGCIPTKAFIESARALQTVRKSASLGVSGVDPEKVFLDWDATKKRAQGIVMKMTQGVEALVRRSGVEIISGEAVINGPGSVTVNRKHLTAGKIIIATGSRPAPVTLEVPAGKILSIDRLMELETLPEHLVVYGRGAVSAEMAQFFSMAGSKVTLVRSEGDFLPGIDDLLQAQLWKILDRSGVRVISGASVSGYRDGSLLTDSGDIVCDALLNASWRAAVVPVVPEDLKFTEDGFIETDAGFETSVPGVFAIGDVNGRAYLAHVASAQGIWLINHFKGIRNTFDLINYPYNIYLTPELAQIGKTEAQLRAEGIPFNVSEFPLSVNGKAMAEGHEEGFIRMLSEARYGQVMGVQIMASNATDMIAEASAIMSIEGTIYDVAQTIHAHPTISEIFMEAGFDAVDKAMDE